MPKQTGQNIYSRIPIRPVTQDFSRRKLPLASNRMELVAHMPRDEIRQNQRCIFYIPLSVQRYVWVKEFIADHPDIKSVTDFGCGNGRIMTWIKKLKQLEAINLVDKDDYMLDREQEYYIMPSITDFIWGREQTEKPLQIKVYAGDMAEPDDLLQADCITLVEVIEHMHLADMERCMKTVFGYYQPKYVVVTTPNCEFNHLLRNPGEPASNFRHFDHKFEWTRAEFDTWAQTIQRNYPYTYHMDGVGHLENSEPYGPCTQIAAFSRVGYKNPIDKGQTLEELFSDSFELNDSRRRPPKESNFRRVGAYQVPSAGFDKMQNPEGLDW